MVKNKKAISAVIGYVLLVTFGIIMSGIVYTYLKTYVPPESLECQDGSSIILTAYECTSSQLNISIKNNGKFNFAGFFIHATNSSEQELATIDLSQYLQNGSSGEVQRDVVFVDISEGNVLKVGKTYDYIFDLSIPIPIEFIEIIPARFQKDGNKDRFVSCGEAKIYEKLNCN